VDVATPVRRVEHRGIQPGGHRTTRDVGVPGNGGIDVRITRGSNADDDARPLEIGIIRRKAERERTAGVSVLGARAVVEGVLPHEAVARGDVREIRVRDEVDEKRGLPIPLERRIDRVVAVALAPPRDDHAVVGRREVLADAGDDRLLENGLVEEHQRHVFPRVVGVPRPTRVERNDVARTIHARWRARSRRLQRLEVVADADHPLQVQLTVRAVRGSQNRQGRNQRAGAVGGDLDDDVELRLAEGWIAGHVVGAAPDRSLAHAEIGLMTATAIRAQSRDDQHKDNEPCG
jgi:hypothetical protein